MQLENTGGVELTAERARAVFLHYAEHALADISEGSDEAIGAALFLATQTWNAVVVEDTEGSDVLTRALERWIRCADRQHRPVLRGIMHELAERKRALFPDIHWLYRDVRLKRLDDGDRYVTVEAMQLRSG